MKIDTKPFQEYIKRLEQAKSIASTEAERQLNRITDRHLARIKENTNAGSSPDSPTLIKKWDRSTVVLKQGCASAEVFNPTKYAVYYEYGHRQTPGRVVFIELRPGESKYGIAAREVKKGKHAGKWGIYLRLKKPYVKGAFVMTDSEAKAQIELDAAVKRIEVRIKEAIG